MSWSETQQRRSDNGEDDVANKLLYRHANALRNRVLEIMPGAAEDTTEENGHKVASLHHQDGSPDLADQETY